MSLFYKSRRREKGLFTKGVLYCRNPRGLLGSGSSGAYIVAVGVGSDKLSSLRVLIVETSEGISPGTMRVVG